MISLPTIAGLLMIIGAVFVFKGLVFHASIVYQLPNSIFAYMSYTNKDWIGLSFVLIGVGLAIATIYKMQTGSLRKSL